MGETIENKLARIARNTDEIKRLNNKAIVSTDIREIKRIKQQADRLLKEQYRLDNEINQMIRKEMEDL
jgi:hypothetical protein